MRFVILHLHARQRENERKRACKQLTSLPELWHRRDLRVEFRSNENELPKTIGGWVTMCRSMACMNSGLFAMKQCVRIGSVRWVVRVLLMRLPAGTARNVRRPPVIRTLESRSAIRLATFSTSPWRRCARRSATRCPLSRSPMGLGGQSSRHRGLDRQTTVVVAAHIREQIRLASDHAMPLLGISFFADCRNVRS